MLDWVTGFIGGLLYPLFSVIFVCIDALQGLFFSLAGVGGKIVFGSANNGATWTGDEITAGNSGLETDSGIIYYLFQNTLVKNLLMSIMLLALFLIIIFTVMAFIKNAYAAKQKGWKEIVGNAIKGLANFIFLPICCLLGVWLANILLQAINGATSGGGTTQMDRKLFICAAYNANEFRNENPDISDENITKLIDWADGRKFINSDETYDGSDIKLGQTADYYAEIVDYIYANTYTSIYDWGSVEKWYSLFEVNYLVLVVGGVFMLYALGTLAFGMIRRMFLLIILFVVSPGVCAMYPLDEGKAVGQWRSEFVKQVLSVHGSVAAINIFFALLPLIDKMHFTGFVGAWAGIDDLIQLFILTSGLMCVKEFTGLLSGFIGGEDAYGKSSGQLKATASKIGKTALGTLGAFTMIRDHARNAGGSLFKMGSAGAKAAGGKLSVAKAKHDEKKEERKAFNYAKRHDMYKKDKNGNLIDDYDVGAARKAMNDEKEAALKAKEAKYAEKHPEKARKRKLASMSYADRLKQMTPEERQARKEELQAKNNKRLAKEQKEAERKARKESGNMTFGDVVRDEFKKAPGGFKSIMATIYEETGLKDKVDQATGKVKKTEDSMAKREKNIAEGVMGEKKINALLKAMEEKGAKKKIELSTDALKVMGNEFGTAVAKHLAGGKLAFDASRLGMDKTSTLDDFTHMDSVLSRLQQYQKRINDSSTPEERAKWVESAMKYASEADANGNDKLQEALTAAMKEFSQAQKDSTTQVKFDSEGIKSLIDASKEAGKVMSKAMQEQVKVFMAEVDKERRKNK